VCVHAEAAPRVELLSRDLEITAARVIRDDPKKKEQKHIEVSEAEADDTEDESSQRGHEGEEEEKDTSMGGPTNLSGRGELK
jgi:hypothetical protein